MSCRYKVLRDCYAFRRLWLKGEEADFADDVNVPEHFKPMFNAAEMIQKRKNNKQSEDEVLVESKALKGEETEVNPKDNEAKRLENMTVAELRSLAAEYGIELEPKMKKDEIIAAIRE